MIASVQIRESEERQKPNPHIVSSFNQGVQNCTS